SQLGFRMSDVGFRVLSCLGSGESAGKEDFGCRNFGFRVWSGFIAAYLFLRLAGAWRVRQLSFDFRGDWRGGLRLGGLGRGGVGGLLCPGCLHLAGNFVSAEVPGGGGGCAAGAK